MSVLLTMALISSFPVQALDGPYVFDTLDDCVRAAHLVLRHDPDAIRGECRGDEKRDMLAVVVR